MSFLSISLRRDSRLLDLLSSYYFWRFRRRHRSYPAFPGSVDIEVTNACNLSCIMCPRDKMSRRIEHMDWGLFEKIASELSTRKDLVNRVSLHLYGEPLLNPRIHEMVSALKAGGMRWVEFSTNCTLLDGDRSEKLLASGLDKVIFAVDGISQETYGRIRTGGVLEQVESNIRDFLSLRKKKNNIRPAVCLQIIVMTETSREVREFKRLWKPYLEKGDSFFIKRIGLQDFNSDLVCEKRDGMPFRVPCVLYPYKALSILADGRVSFCCYDWMGKAVVGDLREETIEQVWHSGRMKDFFDAHLRGNYSDYPLCERCEWTRKHAEIDPARLLFNLYRSAAARLSGGPDR